MKIQQPLKIFILALCFSIPSLAKKNIYILKSPGVCADCAEKIAKMLDAGKIKNQIIGPDDIKKTLQPTDVLIIGGGDSEWDIKQDLLKANAFNWLKRHIANGGTYIGFCAGAYLTEKWVIEGPGTGDKGLDIFPGLIVNYSKTKEARAENVSWLEKGIQRWMYFQDGPAFYPDSHAKVKVLARFSKDNVPAALIFKHGKGTVALHSTHPEADEEWLSDDHVTDPDGNDYDLGLDFIRQVLAYDGISFRQ